MLNAKYLVFFKSLLSKKHNSNTKHTITINCINFTVNNVMPMKKGKCVLIDNHDSFVYNLFQLLNEILPNEVLVMKNDEIDYKILDQAKLLIISPGPDLPINAGDLMYILKEYYDKLPILGICLGHQAIGEYFGGKLKMLKNVFHGQRSVLKLNNIDEAIFDNLTSKISVGRYHSWVVDSLSLPSCLKILSADKDGEIMAIRHTKYKIYGFQFHPESIMTPQGKTLIKNFVKLAS